MLWADLRILMRKTHEQPWIDHLCVWLIFGRPNQMILLHRWRRGMPQDTMCLVGGHSLWAGLLTYVPGCIDISRGWGVQVAALYCQSYWILANNMETSKKHRWWPEHLAPVWRYGQVITDRHLEDWRKQMKRGTSGQNSYVRACRRYVLVTRD